jgi:hypothetical protein
VPLDQSAGDVPALRSIAAIQHGVIALDLSSTVGWAYAPLDALRPITGTWHLPFVGGEGARYAAFENELAAAMDRWQPSKMVLEAPLPLPAMNNWRTACQQFGLRAIAFSEGWRASCAVSEVDVHTARAEVMGQRRLGKDVVKREVTRFCLGRGIKVNSHHAGDAAVVWIWHQQRLRGIPPCAGPLWRGAMQ